MSAAALPDPAYLAEEEEERLADAAAARPTGPRPSRKAVFQRSVRLQREGVRTYVTLDNDLVHLDDVLADWEVLRDAGATLAAAAEQMRLSTKQLEPVLDKALADGDPRGSRERYARDLDPPRPQRKSLRLGRVLDERAVAS